MNPRALAEVLAGTQQWQNHAGRLARDLPATACGKVETAYMFRDHVGRIVQSGVALGDEEGSEAP